MSTYTFGFNSFHPSITLTINNAYGNRVIYIPTNIKSLNQHQCIQRFLCDIKKDSIEKEGTIERIDHILTRIFQNNHDDFRQVDFTSHKSILSVLEQSLVSNAGPKITEYKNIIKTSTTGCNTQISDAVDAFPESGMKCESVIRTTGIHKYSSSAGVLDPISKQDHNNYYNESIFFDTSFTKRLGFPAGTTWKTSPSPRSYNASDVNIAFSTDLSLSLSGTVEDVIKLAGKTTRTLKRGEFRNYCIGNRLKNQKVNTLHPSLQSHDAVQAVKAADEIKKILMMKELGDVAQVWIYFAFNCIKFFKESGNGDIFVNAAGLEQFKEDQFNELLSTTVMVTVDSVVYILCMLLNISCIYTGGRATVESGNCTLKHYFAGPINNKLKLKNLIIQEFNRTLQHTNAIQYGLSQIRCDFNLCHYYVRNSASHVVNTMSLDTNIDLTSLKILFQQKSNLIANNGLSIIRAKEKAIAAFNEIDDTTDISSDQVDQMYNEFCQNIIMYKIPQILTKIKSNTLCKYILMPLPYTVDNLFHNFCNIPRTRRSRGLEVDIILDISQVLTYIQENNAARIEAFRIARATARATRQQEQQGDEEQGDEEQGDEEQGDEEQGDEEDEEGEYKGGELIRQKGEFHYYEYAILCFIFNTHFNNTHFNNFDYLEFCLDHHEFPTLLSMLYDLYATNIGEGKKIGKGKNPQIAKKGQNRETSKGINRGQSLLRRTENTKTRIKETRAITNNTLRQHTSFFDFFKGNLFPTSIKPFKPLSFKYFQDYLDTVSDEDILKFGPKLFDKIYIADDMNPQLNTELVELFQLARIEAIPSIDTSINFDDIGVEENQRDPLQDPTPNLELQKLDFYYNQFVTSSHTDILHDIQSKTKQEIDLNPILTNYINLYAKLSHAQQHYDEAPRWPFGVSFGFGGKSKYTKRNKRNKKHKKYTRRCKYINNKSKMV